jgi:hypothetical protein
MSVGERIVDCTMIYKDICNLLKKICIINAHKQISLLNMQVSKTKIKGVVAAV